ncbi:hypothetical protein M413DRAFT_445246 [Hebeloma cylindrosporum]|uniref:DUF6534 domain-containing protein n=1 Tax=Hebeloma cylindrosporum TaxID=76867 RepID=A0A0C3CCW2_HEBCY|nr:hypothetical protein M413DRAFT_445246 [Hebeloma cylindrosporum h7]
MSSTMLPSRIDLSNTFGAMLVGALVSAMLYGLTTLQTYFYYVYYPNDSLGTRVLVFTIWVIDTLHGALMSLAVYHYLVINYNNPAELAFGHWSLFASVAVNTVISCIVQWFFLIRIHRLCNIRVRWFVSSIIGLTVIAHFAFGIETVVFMFIKREFIKLSEINLQAATPFAIFAVLSDIMIAGSLCYLLYGSRTGFKRTDTIVTTLIVYAINRCLLTSVVAVIEVIVFSTVQHSLWFVGIDFVIGKLYANSLLATLNSREAIRAANPTTVNSVRLSDMEFNHMRSGTKNTRDLTLDFRSEGSTTRHTQFSKRSGEGQLEEEGLAPKLSPAKELV